MKSFLLLAATVAAIGAGPAIASQDGATQAYRGGDVVEHSGGCRKNSPPGKCCHAGSQPLHCH